MSEQPQEGGVTWSAGEEEGVWAFHLTQDILHDELGDTSYAIVPPALPPGARGGEGGTYDFLVGRASAQDPNFGARQSKVLSFSINKGTETFQQWNAPTLYGANNASVGIVQDAGKFITKLLGAQNVITFGHVLDPAGTTVDPKTDPILYIPPAGQNAITIDLGQFGFNRDIISSIDVSDFTAGTVKCVWKYKGVPIDAISTKPVVAGTPLMAKQLNNPRTENAGFFVSRADAMGKGNLAPGIDLLPYKIGKTLGDTLLVASAMPSFAGPVPNPFYGPGGVAAGWQRFGPAPPGAGAIVVPRVLMLKTGDKLNHLRAILKDVPSILEKPAAGGNGRMFEFFPGAVDDETLMRELKAAYNALPGVVTERYNRLIAQFRAQVAGGVLNPVYARFTSGNPSLSGTGLQYGGVVFEMIANRLESTRDHILGIVTAEATAFQGRSPDVSARLIEYQTANEFVNRIAPATADILTNRGFVNQNIVIITAPSGGYSAGTPFQGIRPVKIMLHSIFMKLEQNKARIAAALGGGGAGIQQILEQQFASTLFGEHFWQRTQFLPQNQVGGPALPAVGGDVQTGGWVEADNPYHLSDVDNAALTEMMNELVYGYMAPQIPRVAPVLAILSERFEERAPLFMEFAGYTRRSKEDVFSYVIYLNARRYSNRLYSTYVLDELIDEINGVIGRPVFPQIPQAVPVPDSASAVTVMYNAFVFHKNAEYARDPGLTGEAQLSDMGFAYCENLIRSSVGVVQAAKAEKAAPRPKTGSVKSRAVTLRNRRMALQLRSPNIAAPAPPFRVGGLRPRRPLYSNAESTDSPRVHSDNDPGLRERTRTRRTRRLRKSTRKSTGKR